MVDRQDILRIAEEVEEEVSIFSAAASPCNKIVGRADKARELVRALAGCRMGRAHPFVFVYGRTDSGKSTVRFSLHKLLRQFYLCDTVLHRMRVLRKDYSGAY